MFLTVYLLWWVKSSIIPGSIEVAYWFPRKERKGENVVCARMDT